MLKFGSTWKRIVNQWEQLEEWGIGPKKVIKRKIGNGRKTKFWFDWWIGEKTLWKTFPILFKMERNNLVEFRGSGRV